MSLFQVDIHPYLELAILLFFVGYELYYWRDENGVVREVYLALKNFRSGDCSFRWFSVEAENFESIHNHNAYAYAETLQSLRK